MGIHSFFSLPSHLNQFKIHFLLTVSVPYTQTNIACISLVVFPNLKGGESCISCSISVWCEFYKCCSTALSRLHWFLVLFYYVLSLHRFLSAHVCGCILNLPCFWDTYPFSELFRCTLCIFFNFNSLFLMLTFWICQIFNLLLISRIPISHLFIFYSYSFNLLLVT